jgi:CubicO group peptidase (beta-lactamase class C family)
VMPGRTGPTDPIELAKFLDTTMPGLLSGWRVPGAVVVVVKDGHILAQKGYGLADVAAGESVDPEHTLFRIASVTKLFTATAVLQLAEQGKVQLGVDAQVYLPDVRLPRTFARPVTVADLLTHTSGFDERTIGTAARTAAAACRPASSTATPTTTTDWPGPSSRRPAACHTRRSSSRRSSPL